VIHRNVTRRSSRPAGFLVVRNLRVRPRQLWVFN
jgi:hypothetical protein